MFVRTPFNYDSDVASYTSGLDMSDAVSRTQQHFKDEVDIRAILARFRRGADMPEPVPASEFADFSDVVDFHTAMNQIARSNQLFYQYPAALRERFRNDPGEFLAFVEDPESNLDEGVRLGIFRAPEPGPASPEARPEPQGPGGSGDGAPES